MSPKRKTSHLKYKYSFWLRRELLRNKLGWESPFSGCECEWRKAYEWNVRKGNSFRKYPFDPCKEVILSQQNLLSSLQRISMITRFTREVVSEEKKERIQMQDTARRGISCWRQCDYHRRRGWCPKASMAGNSRGPWGQPARSDAVIQDPSPMSLACIHPPYNSVVLEIF